MNQLQQIGTDAEYFVRKDGVITSAIGLIGGSKDKPFDVFGGNLQEDNILAEFAINPCSSSEQFIARINRCTESLRQKLKGYTLVAKASHEFSLPSLIEMGDDAFVFGCDPDYNAYTGNRNNPPDHNSLMRTAAGHVHFSYANPNETKTRAIIKALDYTLGIWSLLVDEDDCRRTMYGTAGSYRNKPYGGEYRVLGNFWLRGEDSMRYVFDTTAFVVQHAEELLPRFQTIVGTSRLQDIINTYQCQAAELVYKQISDIVEEYHAQLHK